MDSRRCQAHPPVCGRYQRAAELLGRRWSAAVIRATLDGPRRFTEIRGSVDGISARLLAERLRELEAAGLMERRERGAAVEYRLTPKGEALSRVVREIEAWVAAWDDDPEDGQIRSL
ncbi:MAG: winged helix-turn-helix transcriptional regulator [Thermoleophilia bacterium]